ncbi:glycoside hydrolase family 16 protein [Microbulbifer hydrolyticus]|uniref:Beta-glucanase (GH16 family) n=2 Tax=Microbulbifer hydrolyticus TaxID=48074 RepID=A0AA89T5J7_9GAMM|nr:glycoside hydrolase family 16 protein [Microbulbifer hydrolyticus]MBB5212664.1 beta-glucanase (GH16 family) [Microbulbifer hydrolyticus]
MEKSTKTTSLSCCKRGWLGALCLALQPMISATAFAQTEPVWSDEFDGEQIDRSVWTYNTGGSGFGNGEMQFYTASQNNAYIEDGNLVIEARRENYEGKPFTSARLHTNGRFGFKFGTLEARIKLPKLDNGLWPAFWMLGDNYGVDGWPKSGEIDILEAGFKSAMEDGSVNNAVSGAVHWWHETGTWSDWLQASHSQHVVLADPLYTDYHTYRLDWTPEEIIISVDDTRVLTMDTSDPALSEFRDNPMHILLNLAVGGWNFVEITDPAQITADFPAKMYVDYVRLYANEHTELEVAAEDYISGDFGVLTETHPVENTLNWEDNTNLYVWSNMQDSSPVPFEGSEALGFTVQPGNWWGMGLLHPDYNLHNYKHGTLQFDMRVDSDVNIEVHMMSTAGGQGTVVLANGGDQYGLVRDGGWHHVTIPLSKFGGVDMETVQTLFAISGPAPASAFEIAVDNIYLTESTPLPAPQNGNFGIYTETAANTTAGALLEGQDSDLFIWEGTLNLAPATAATSAPEGEAALNFSSTGKGWFGMGFAAREGFDLSAFDNHEAALHFSMRTTDQTEFRVGLKSGNVQNIGQTWVTFAPGNDPYGFVRDGQWQDVVIPMSDLSGDLEMTDMRQLFQLLGFGEISDLSIDNIYLSGGASSEPDGDVCKPVRWKKGARKCLPIRGKKRGWDKGKPPFIAVP